jgi:histidinol-phosphatase
MTSALEHRKHDLGVALRLADIADAISMRGFRSVHPDSHWKADGGIVTAADLEIEEALRDELTRTCPQDAILGEEFGSTGKGPRLWTLDPIDGTAGYAQGNTEWATLISLVEEGVAVVGVVSRPADTRRWWAAEGVGAFRDDQPIRVSHAGRLAEAVLLEDFRISVGRQLTTNPLPTLAGVCDGVHPTFEKFDLIGVAEGTVDVVLLWYSGTGPDLYSRVCIVSEAGGRHSDLRGISDVDAQVQLMTNGLVHDEALALVNDLIAAGSVDPAVEPTEDFAAIEHARALQPKRMTRRGRAR